jgi:hypothetical protein
MSCSVLSVIWLIIHLGKSSFVYSDVYTVSSYIGTYVPVPICKIKGLATILISLIKNWGVDPFCCILRKLDIGMYNNRLPKV